MVEKRILIREVLSATPDGNAVRRTEHLHVEIVFFDENVKSLDSEAGYTEYGEWRIVQENRKH